MVQMQCAPREAVARANEVLTWRQPSSTTRASQKNPCPGRDAPARWRQVESVKDLYGIARHFRGISSDRPPAQALLAGAVLHLRGQASIARLQLYARALSRHI